MRTLYPHTPHALPSLVPHAGERPDVPPLPAFAEPSRLVDEAEDFSALIGDVYDAAISPARWPAALDRAAKFVGGTAAAIYSKDATRKSGEFYYDNGCIDPQSRRLYREEYVRLDPTTGGHLFAQNTIRWLG